MSRVMRVRRIWMIACMQSRRISRNLTKSFVTSVTPLKRPRCSQPVLAEPYRSPKMVRLVRTGWSRAYSPSTTFVCSITDASTWIFGWTCDLRRLYEGMVLGAWVYVSIGHLNIHWDTNSDKIWDFWANFLIPIWIKFEIFSQNATYPWRFG